MALCDITTGWFLTACEEKDLTYGKFVSFKRCGTVVDVVVVAVVS